MRREEYVMDVLGELDDRLLAEAMPMNGSDYGTAAEIRHIAFETPDKSAEISKKDLRIYRMTRALGMAAVVALIVGAVVLFMQNWDKIAVSGGERPGVITTISEPVVTSVDNEHGALYVNADEHRSFDDFDVHVTGYEFDRLWCKLYIDVTYKGVEPFTFNIKIEGNEERAQTASRFDKISEDGDTVSYSVEVFDLKSAKYDANIIFTKWDGTESFTIPVNFSGKLPTGDIEVNRDIYTYNNKKVTLETIWVCPYVFGFKYKADSIDDIDDLEKDFRIILNSGEELKLFAIRSVGDDNGGVFVQALVGDVYADPDIRVNDRIVSSDDIKKIYVGDALVYTAPSPDPLEQADDTSMPEIFGIDDPRASMWDMKFQFRYRYVRELCSDESFLAFTDKFVSTNRQTHYTLDDNPNIYCWTTALGIPADDVCDAVMKNNEYYRNEAKGLDMDAYIWTDEEIEAFRSGDRQKIAETFASEYSIVVGENVFSPQWLYYHTTEDYSAVGITPEEVLHKLDMYEGLGLTDEAWAAFSAKLQKYADKADPFGQITDTTMPRPFPIEQDYDHMSFESQWKTKAVGAAIDCRGRENYDEWNRMCMSIRTPYRLDDNNNVAGVIKQFGITSGEIDEYFEKRNARWQESLEKAEERGNEGAIMNCRNEIFSDEEINALKSGYEAEIIALFMSDYSIWLTDSSYVISPEWLYYHTIEDYSAIGITPQMIASKIPLYEDTFIGNNDGNDMADESWELFKEKLTKYAGIDKEEKQQEQTVYAELPVPEKYYRNISESSLDELVRDFLLENKEQFDMFWRLYLWGYNAPETTDLFRKYPDSENPDTEHLYCKQDSSVLPFGTIDGFRDWMREYFSDDVYEQYRERLFDGWYQDGYYVPPYFIEENGELYRYGMTGNPKPEIDFNTAKVIDMEIRKISGDWSEIIDGTLWFACIGPEFTMPALNYTAYYGKLEIKDGEIRLGFIPCIDLPEYHGETTGDIKSIWSEKNNENMKNKFADAAAELSGTMIEIDDGIEEPDPTDEVTIIEDDEF